MKKLLSLLLSVVLVLSMTGCGQPEVQEGLGNGWEPTHSMDVQFAHEFSVDYYEGGYKLITLGDGSRYLTIPEGAAVPKRIARDIVPLQQPVENIYLAATAAMCLFDSLDRLDTIRLSGTQADGWYIDSAKAAMERGEILYAGKYSEPDYELILSSGCSLAVESTMIGHASEVKEKLNELGVPVLIDQASHETHPLGRSEWIKLYGALLDEEEKAEEMFSRQVSFLEEVASESNTGKTVAFFHISSSGYVVARKSGDYVSKMIELAGGNYVFENLGDPEKNNSTVTIEMETFYATAKDADFIIYNSAITGEIETLEQLLKINPLLKDFKAVQNGNVWCTAQNMYQETMQLGQMTREMHLIFTATDADALHLDYLYKLK